MTLEPQSQRVDPASPPSPEPLLGFGPGAREVLVMAFPVIVATCSATLMGFVDFWMVARLGVAEAAAISPSGILLFSITAFFMGALSCTNTFVSQSYGRHDVREGSRYTWQGLWISGFVGLGVMALWPVAPAIFRLLNHGAQLERLETIYFQWRLPSTGSIVATMALTGFFQGISRPRVTMVAAVVANALNVFFNWVFIYGNLGSPPLGVAGAALGTVIASWVQLFILLGLFLSPGLNRAFASRTLWRIDGHRMGRLFHVGVPAGLSWLLDIGTWGIFINVFVGRLGETALAASNMATQWLHISFMPTVALGIAVTALVGQNIGRRDLPLARARARAGLLIGMAYMFLVGLAFFFFREPLIRLFVKPDDPQATEIVQVGAMLLILSALFQIFDAMGIVSSSALKGAGDTRFPALTSIVLGLLVFLPMSWVATDVFGWGVVGAWGAATIYVFALGIVMLWRWNSRAWESIDIFRRRAAEAVDVLAKPTPYEPGDEISAG